MRERRISVAIAVLLTAWWTPGGRAWLHPSSRIRPSADRRLASAISLLRKSTGLCLAKSSSSSTEDSDDIETNESIRPSKQKKKTSTKSIPASITVDGIEVSFQVHSSITKIDAESWDECIGDGNPFLEHAWLRCLEESECACTQTGWSANHLSIHGDKNELLGYCPLYIKSHSLGEFIFDQGWAEAAYQVGIQYYPKLLVGVPFTPATGRRLLWRPDVLEKFSAKRRAGLHQATFAFLRQIATTAGLSSVHGNFLTEDEAGDIAGALPGDDDETESMATILLRKLRIKDDYVRRTSLQYHWTNQNPNNDGKPFESFDDYLACFKSKRRISIRRERRRVLEDEGIQITVVRGKEIRQIPGLVERMFEIYLSTIEKMAWGRQYLTLDFFERLAASDFCDNLCFLCAHYKPKDGDEVTPNGKLKAENVIAGTFNIVKDGAFYGRYWGCVADEEIKNLHFETCYWAAIEYCIQEGLQRMEPGAGGGDYKWARGFDPVLIHSVHYICHPGLRRAVQQFVHDETSQNVELTNYLQFRRQRNSSERSEILSD